MNKRFWSRNAPTILSCIGGVGVVVTTVLAVKATPKAISLLEEAKAEKGEELTKFEAVKTAAPAYIPTALVGVSTIACIFGANVLNKRQQASLMSAYALLDTSYKEYKKKLKEMYGEETDKKVRAEIFKDHYKKEDIPIEEDDKLLFYEEYSGRYFRATDKQVLQAAYEINKILAEDCYASLNEYYELLGIPRVAYGDHVGWPAGQLYDMYGISWLSITHEKVEMDDGLECYILSIPEPFVDFEDY